jgi:hypothetical protein
LSHFFFIMFGQLILQLTCSGYVSIFAEYITHDIIYAYVMYRLYDQLYERAVPDVGNRIIHLRCIILHQ